MEGERSSRKRQCREEEEARRKGQLSGQESERQEKIKGKRRQRQSGIRDQGVDRLQNGIAPVAGVPAVIHLEQHLYIGSFSYSLYFIA